jgi:hypothetical protein
MESINLTAEPLNSGAPGMGAPNLTQVHALQAKALTTKPPQMGGELPPEPDVHHLKAVPPTRRRKRDRPRIDLIQTVLRLQVPEWNQAFPTVKEMPNRKLQIKGKKSLEKDPRTSGPDWEWKKIRKSFMRAVGREKLK